MMYKAKVKYYENDCAEVNHFLIINGESYLNVMERIIDYYKDGNLESVSLSVIAPEDFIIFEENEKDLFAKVTTVVEGNAGW